MNAREKLTYPNSCLSAYCGAFGDACTGCRNFPRLVAWREYAKQVELEHKADVEKAFPRDTKPVVG